MKTFWRGLLVGVLILVVNLLVSAIFNAIFPTLAVEYQNPSLFRPWSDPLMSLYFLHPFILGIILTAVWFKVGPLIKGGDFRRGFKFALGVWLLATLPGMLISYSSFQLSLLIVLSWTIASFISLLLVGWLLARVERWHLQKVEDYSA